MNSMELHRSLMILPRKNQLIIHKAFYWNWFEKKKKQDFNVSGGEPLMEKKLLAADL